MSVRNFDLNQKEKSSEINSDPQQLNFSDLQFHLPHVDFTEIPELSESGWTSLRALSYQRVTKRYFSLSIIVHALLASAVLFLNIPISEEPKKETITIEIQELSGNEAPVVNPLPIKAAKAPVAALPEKAEAQATPVASATPATPAPAPEDSSEVIDEPVIKLKPIAAAPIPKPVKTEVKPKAQAVKSVPAAQKPAAPAKTSSAAKPQLLSEESEVAVPESLDDIQSPDLDETSVKDNHPQQAEAKISKDVEKDLKHSDEQDEDLVAKESEQLKAIAKNLEDESQENLKAIEAQDKAEQEAVQKASARRRQQEAQAIAAANAKAEAERASAAKAAAAAAAANQGGNGQGDGEAEQTGAAPGVGDVRSLQDMRQMPGNPKPSYDYNERLRGDAGEVVFLAYVTRDGSTSQFKMMKSTGHRNLDLKTLKALKKWKFYPGQEGWVEFPFRWDLNGGPAEMPTMLRRR